MDKKLVYLAIGVGGLVGAYLPVVLFHVDGFSVMSIIGSIIGAFLGLFVAYKIIQNY